MKNIRSFTLIEVLISTAIFAVVLVAVYSAFQAGTLSYNKIDSAAGVFQPVRVIFNRMELDIKNAFVYGKDDAQFHGTAQSLDFFTVVDSFDENGKISPNLALVKYEFSDNKLKRTCLVGLDALDANSTQASQDLLDNLEDFSIEYAFRTLNPDNPYEWQKSWPKESDDNQKKNLPLAVKITLSLRDAGVKSSEEARRISFTKVIELTQSNLK